MSKKLDAEVDGSMSAQGLPESSLLGFIDEHPLPDWLPPTWVSVFWPMERTIESALQWVNRARFECEFCEQMSRQNDMLPAVQKRGDYVHDAYRVVEQLKVSPHDYHDKPIRDNWSWLSQGDALRRVFVWLHNHPSRESAP